MSDLPNRVNALRRPRLLLQAARHGLNDYCRDRTLRRLLRESAAPAPRRAVSILLLAESTLETARIEGDAAYSPARHVETLIALIAEARLLASETARNAARNTGADPRPRAALRAAAGTAVRPPARAAAGRIT